VATSVGPLSLGLELIIAQAPTSFSGFFLNLLYLKKLKKFAVYHVSHEFGNLNKI
jgi:hypothetical protein